MGGGGGDEVACLNWEHEARRSSLDVCFGNRPSTLFDEWEREAIEEQLQRAILRRSFSQPSPVLLPPARLTKRSKMSAMGPPSPPSKRRGIRKVAWAVKRVVGRVLVAAKVLGPEVI
ncbi:hypothetical protein HPP92_019054 [Vanilla planifolia]|uniref:Uncharacterized protein n=1 Tax=Vanilla planifolia TaxID=51239 RepID=A0A835QD86_VANPL|nr:hypothetical protein HPP92_019054 [Vanilla planifolia]